MINITNNLKKFKKLLFQFLWYKKNSFDSINISSPLSRANISYEFLKGYGIEIGALHNPLQISKNVNIKYVDRKSKDDLKVDYPELSNYNLVDVDIIDDGEKLESISNNTLDFIIANHMIEHCRNPIQTISNFCDKLKTNGLLYIAVPDKRFTFDFKRPLTEFSHILEDYKNPNEKKDFEHFVEWTKLVENIENEEELLKVSEITFKRNYSIHYHVWDNNTFFSFLLNVNEVINNKYSIIFYFSDEKEEIITILKKK